MLLTIILLLAPMASEAPPRMGGVGPSGGPGSGLGYVRDFGMRQNKMLDDLKRFKEIEENVVQDGINMYQS